MKYFSFFFALAILAVIFYAANYFYNQTYEETMTEIRNNPPISVPKAPIPTSIATESAEPATSSAIPSEWKKIISSNNYSIRIPSFIQNNSSAEGDRFYFLGPTQSLGSELSDGISVFITLERLNNKTLQVIAKEQQAISAKAETTESITTISAVKFGEHKGFQYKTTALGISNSYYIPHTSETYLKIISTVASPENNISYQDTVDKMLSSISFK